MMQNSNNRPDGSQAIQCDAGTPIMGRTSTTGTYQILKVNSDGSIAGLPSPIADSGCVYECTPGVIPSPMGAFAGGVTLMYTDVITTSINAGSYTIAPFWGAMLSTTGGAVSFALIKVGSSMDAYCSSLLLGTDAFAPTITLAFNGMAQAWHNISVDAIGTIAGFSYSTGNANVLEKQCYLESGTYKMAVICHTAFTTATPFMAIGLSVANG